MIDNTNKLNKFTGVHTYLYWGLVLFLWVLYGLNTWTVDSVSYISFYNVFLSGGWFGGVEIGFATFMNISALMGLSYQQFLMIYSLVGLLLIAITLKRVAKRPFAVLFLFFLFPFPHEVSALRNFMAMAITFWGTQYLIGSKYKDTLKFILSIAIASLFHKSALIYLILILVKIERKKINYIAILVLIIEMVLIVSNSLLYILPNLVPKTVVYLESGLSGTQFYTKVLFIFYFVIIVYISNKLYEFLIKDSLKSNFYLNDIKFKYSKIVYKVMLLSIIFYPIILFDVDFYRLARNLLLMFYVLLTNVTFFDKNLNMEKNRLITYLNSKIFITCLVIFFLLLFSFESVLVPIFKNNLLFEFII